VLIAVQLTWIKAPGYGWRIFQQIARQKPEEDHMAAFLGDIAFLFGILIIAAGLMALHRAITDPHPVLLKTTGIVLLAAGIGTALCTGYYYLKYHFAGDLEHPYPIVAGEMSRMQEKLGRMHRMKMMGGEMDRERSRMDRRGGGRSAEPPEESD